MYAMKGRNVRKGAKKEVRDIKNLTANRKLATKMRQSTENITNTTKELFRYSETNKSQLRSIICNTYDIDIRNSNKNSCIVYYYLHGDFFALIRDSRSFTVSRETSEMKTISNYTLILTMRPFHCLQPDPYRINIKRI